MKNVESQFFKKNGLCSVTCFRVVHLGIFKTMIKNCVNCCAPINKLYSKCPYCDTPYELTGFSCDIDPSNNRGVLNICGHSINVSLTEMETDVGAIPIASLTEPCSKMIYNRPVCRTFTFTEI